MKLILKTLAYLLIFVGIFFLITSINLSMAESICNDPEGGIIHLPKDKVIACIVFPVEELNESLGL